MNAKEARQLTNKSLENEDGINDVIIELENIVQKACEMGRFRTKTIGKFCFLNDGDKLKVLDYFLEEGFTIMNNEIIWLNFDK